MLNNAISKVDDEKSVETNKFMTLTRNVSLNCTGFIRFKLAREHGFCERVYECLGK